MKVKRFNNLWAMGLILCGVLLIAFYVAKIFFPEFIIWIAETPSLVEIGTAIQANKCYSHLIEKVLYGVPKNCDDMTVNDFAEIHPQGTYLLRMNGHITTLIDYTVFDLFDCREYFITNAWEIR